MERQSGAQVVPLPAEGVRQAGEAPHLHADVQVRPLDVGRANPLLFRGSGDDQFLGAYYRGGRVAALGIDRLRPEDLDDLAVVDSPPEVLLDGGGISIVVIR